MGRISSFGGQLKHGGFELGRYYWSLICTTDMSFPWRSIQRSKVLPRVGFFTWTAALGKILTINDLQKRSLLVQTGVICVNVMGRLWAIYSFTVSYSYKVVVHGVLVWSFLGYAEECCGVTSFLARSVWPSSKYSYLESHSCCLMWCIWWEHNAQSFEDYEWMIPKLKPFLFKTFIDWMLTFGSFSICTFF